MNKNKYWFKLKKYGYGFTPISWEGWLATLIFVALIFVSAYINDFFISQIELKEGLRFSLDLIILTTLFSIISANRTKEKLGWHWGNRK